MTTRESVALSTLTTLRVGGPARHLVEAGSADQLVEVVAAADSRSEPLLVLAGGSNLVVADRGFDGTVVHVISRGVQAETDGERVRVTAAAGEPWDELVAWCVANQLAGIECLSGVPGSTGATPIQNVGAYGQEVSDTVASVRAYDRRARRVVELSPPACRFAYRSSALRHSARYVVLAVTFALHRSVVGGPLGYAELARALGSELGGRAPLRDIREAVIELRARKGMVLDPEDPDSISVGSFFVNPIVPCGEFEALARRTRAKLGDGARPVAWPAADGHVKLSAAWLIERAGFSRGYGRGRAALSSKHALALVNRGGASASEIVSLARELRDGVRATFGVTLRPEPTLVGIEL